jgi:hypothetical protein|tara:strand:+ start:66 stop:374 length:309 start_codon:yes stop_codon:yes gene_type:complete
MKEDILREAIRKEIHSILKEAPSKYGSGLGSSERQKVSRIFQYMERKGLSRFLGMLKTDIEKAQAIVKFADMVGLPINKVSQLRSQLVKMKADARRSGERDV